MKYNIAKNGITATNSGIGNVILSSANINDLLEKNLSYSLVTPDTLVIDCDLGYRINVYQPRYYFDSASASGTVSGSLSFYYWNDSNGGYVLSGTEVGPNYYYTTISGTSSPRKIRLIHTVSGTAISGTLTGFEVLNDDSVVDFGEDGLETSANVITSLSSSDITNTIKIYNSGTAKSKAYASIEPQMNSSDEMLFIANSTNGPWYGPNLDNSLLANDEDSWDEGSYNNTEFSSGNLVLSAGQSTGTYTSKIFYDHSVMSNTLVGLSNNEYSTLVSMGVRHSNTKPENLATFVEIRTAGGTGDNSNTYYKEYFWSDGSEYASVYLGNHNYHYSYRDREIRINNSSNTFFMLLSEYSAYHGNTGFSISRYRIDSSSFVSQTLWGYSGYASVSIYDLGFDANEGVWFHTYVAQDSNSSSDILDKAGYYLVYLDNSFSSTAEVFATSQFSAGMGVVYSTGEVWYTNTNNSQVIKMSNNGDVLFSATDAEYTNDLGHLVVKSDGGCWFVNGNDLHELSSSGELLTSLEGVGTSVTKIGLDPEEDTIWVLDGAYIRRIYTDGREVFSYYTSNQGPTKLYPVKSGVWYTSTNDDKVRFVSTNLQTEVVSYAYDLFHAGNDVNPGFREVSYDTEGFTDEFPLSFDTHWNNLKWKSVDYRNYILSEDSYHQIRLTLNKQGSDSPEVTRLSVQDNLEVGYISPDSYRDVYLKTTIPDSSDTSYTGDYDSYLRVRWGIPI